MYMLGEVFSKAIPFLLLPYLTRVLGPAGYGELSLYQVIAALLIVALSLSQDGAVARYYYAYGKRAIGLINFTGVLYSSVIYLIICVVSFVTASEILFVCASVSYTQSIISNQLTIRQMQRKVKEYLYIQVFNSLFSAFLTVLLFEIFNASALGRLYIVMLVNLLTIILAVMVVAGGASESFRKVRINRKKIKISLLFILSFGTPLIIHNLSLFSKGQLDRVFVYNLYSEEQLGLYSVGFQIASILAIILMAAQKSLTPYYFEALKKKSLEFCDIRKLLFYIIIVIPLPAILAYMLPSSVYAYVFGDNFVESKVYACIFLLGIAMNAPYFLLANYLFYHGKTVAVSIGTGVSSALHIVLIATLGSSNLKMMAFTLFITNSFTICLIYFFCRRYSQGLQK
ncbi:oligosaccharide flippase family protein [Alkalimonas sp. MEB004]|uniref:Oligosaccharide flippase family protein n=1 Tax=Alkalimonas mucilaginosa TaxID=3057676 RepID=A0ABU7JC68_9GAMM|nr:oligosaccharide flippase family protein [Alkalimonas sp. MEB004]MEE2023031.1 oligosaccharide flippase family protein [Alkalimonas sp. MEB004]